MKKCKKCGEKFVPKYNSFEKYCQEEDCRIAGAIEIVANKKITDEKKRKKDCGNEKAVLKDKLMTLTDWQKLLEKPVNKICCLLDRDAGCISCNGKTTPQAGHYHSVKSNGSIRFNLNNLHLQDFNCNCKKGANTHQYDLGLIERYGKEYWEYVKFDIVAEYPLLKMAKHEYQEKINIANSIVKWLKLQNKTYSVKEMLELREKYNKQIGIYIN
jgi:hypothetical protein